MKLFVASLMIAVVAAETLVNTYLPPSNGKSAGGNGDFLNPPSSKYGVPEPSATYLPDEESSNGRDINESLVNTYLPPSSGKSAGGNGDSLNPPSSKYGVPEPSATYLPAQKSSNGRDINESLVNTYLPPSSGKSAGGNGDSLNPPSSKYGVPQPSATYLPGEESSNARDINGGSAQNPDGNAATLRFDNANNGDGSYKFGFETENKIKRAESGELKNLGTEQEVTVVQGSYSYLGADGIEYTVTYVADENGFQASGEHLPTSPPIPEAILKSLEKNAAEEAQQGYPSGPAQNGYQDAKSAGYQYSEKSAQNDKESIAVESLGNNGDSQQVNRQPPQAPGRQYLTPSKSGFDGKTGYQY